SSRLAGAGVTPDSMSSSTGELAFSAGVELNAETYQQLDPGETRWEYGHERRRPFLNVPLQAWLLDSGYARLDLSLTRNYHSFDDYITRETSPQQSDSPEDGRNTIPVPEPDPRSNIPSRLHYIDPQFPFRSFASFGGEHWSTQIGRDRISWGPGRTGTLAISDYADYHEALRFATFFDSFKYSYFWINAPRFTESELAELEDDGDGDGSGITSPLERNYIGHRIDLRPHPRLNIGMYELYIIAKESMEFRYLHPVMLYHNHFLPQGNSSIMAGLDIDFTIAPGWNLYGEYAFNSLMFNFLHRDAADADPDAWAALMGVETVRPAQRGYWSAGIEGVYTNPWFGVHRQPQTAFTHSRRTMAEHVDGYRYVTVEKPLGYSAGPDFVGLFVDAGYTVPRRLNIDTTLSLQGKGRRDLYIGSFDEFDSENDTSPSPSGDHPQWRTVAEIDASVQPFELAGMESPVPFDGALEIGSHLAAIRTLNRRRPGELPSQSGPEFDLQWAARISLHW
ncbi:MAG: capsule assembly Wzi family protein, partial [Spirochaetota bacterium]